MLTRRSDCAFSSCWSTMPSSRVYTVRVHLIRRTAAFYPSRPAIEVKIAKGVFGSVRIACRTAFLAILFCSIAIAGQTPAPKTVCDHGSGQFETDFPTGVSVRVGADHRGAFATRMCTATLSWDQDHLVAVANAPQVDIDVLGADLGLGVPVVSFQVRNADDDWQPTYLIYSLRKKPRLLKTLTGGDSYRAVDADFNRKVAIWTKDAAAVNGLDGLAFADYDSPPTIVLRFEHGKLTDVSADYQPQYDQQIASLRAQLSAQELSSFHNSDGRLAFGSAPAADLTQLRKTKVKVLEIVWAYLYSGRPQQAWAELDEAWPPADAARIKAEILAARAKGIESQVTAIASAKLPSHWQESPVVYHFVRSFASASGHEVEINGESGNVKASNPLAFSPDQLAVDSAPVAILLWRPPLSASQQSLARSQETLKLVIDEAGKVHSAELLSPNEDPELMNATKNWKFIPAIKDGQPVAYTMKLGVSPYQ